MDVSFENTEYGFKYGAAEITRLHSDKQKGWVVLQLKTPKQDFQIYVTKTGKVVIINNNESITLKMEQKSCKTKTSTSKN